MRRLTDPDAVPGELEQALDTWSSWAAPLRARPRPVGAIGGLTNTSWLVDTSCGRAVVRLNSAVGERLGIDRRREAQVLARLAGLDVAPPVWHCDPAAGLLVTAFVPGRVWRDDDMANPRQRRRLQALVARYQQRATGLPARDYAVYLDDYWQYLRRLSVVVPDAVAARYEHCRAAIPRWQESLRPVLTHHDLTPANIIDYQGRLCLLDWEYAAPGCGAIDRFAAGEEVSPTVEELVALINELWSLLRQAS